MNRQKKIKLEILKSQTKALEVISLVYKKYLKTDYNITFDNIFDEVSKTDNPNILLAIIYILGIHSALNANDNFVEVKNHIWGKIKDKDDEKVIYKVVKTVQRLNNYYIENVVHNEEIINKTFMHEDLIKSTFLHGFHNYYHSSKFMSQNNKALLLYCGSFWGNEAIYDSLFISVPSYEYFYTYEPVELFRRLSYINIWDNDLLFLSSERAVTYSVLLLCIYMICEEYERIPGQIFSCHKNIKARAIKEYLKNTDVPSYLEWEKEGFTNKSLIIYETLKNNDCYYLRNSFVKNKNYINACLELGDGNNQNVNINISNIDVFSKDIIYIKNVIDLAIKKDSSIDSKKTKKKILLKTLKILNEMEGSSRKDYDLYRNTLIHKIAYGDLDLGLNENQSVGGRDIHDYRPVLNRLCSLIKQISIMEQKKNIITQYAKENPVMYTLLLINENDIQYWSESELFDLKNTIVSNKNSDIDITTIHHCLKITNFLLKGDFKNQLFYLVKNEHKNLLEKSLKDLVSETSIMNSIYIINSISNNTSEEDKDTKTYINNSENQSLLDIPEEKINTASEHIIYTSKSEAEIVDYIEEETSAILNVMLRKIRKSGNTRKLQNNNGLFSNIENLRESFPNFSEFIDYIEDHAILNKLGDNHFYIPPSLLIGEPGIGKTFFLSELAKSIGIENKLIHMETITASWILTGSSPQWKDAKTGIIYNNIVKSKYANNILILDEIDKISSGNNYPPANTLLQILESHTAKEFQDEFFPLKLDISKTVWLATANSLSSISEPVLSRFNVFNIKNQTFAERKIMAQRIYSILLSKNSWGEFFNKTLPENTLDVLCQPDDSIREMQKTLMDSITKAARRGDNTIKIQDVKNNKTSSRNNVGF